MADYTGLPQVILTATADSTGKNTGNWTNAFTSATPSWPFIPQWEIYHMTVTSGPVLGAATIFLRGSLYSSVTIGTSGSNEWDPEQPAIVNSGDELDFFWNVAASGTAPIVTVWGRYDAALARNLSYLG
jgi:hypothetical protein